MTDWRTQQFYMDSIKSAMNTPETTECSPSPSLHLDSAAAPPRKPIQYTGGGSLIQEEPHVHSDDGGGPIGQGDVSSVLPSGQTALTAAILGGHSEAFDLLLEVGADPNVSSTNGPLPLELAVVKKCPLHWIEKLLANGASPDVKDTESDQSLLQCAWLQNSEKVLQLLLKYGADPKLLPVELTAFTESGVHWLGVFLDAGGNPDAKCKRSGLSILQLACLHGREDLVQFLLSRGVNADGPAARPRTARPLRLVMELKDQAVRGRLMDHLLQHGARVDAPDVYQNCPLFFACIQGDLDSVVRFLQHCPDACCPVAACPEAACPEASCPVHPVEAFTLLGHCSHAASLLETHPMPVSQLVWAALYVRCSRCLRLCLDNGLDLDSYPFVIPNHYSFLLNRGHTPYSLIHYAMSSRSVSIEGFDSRGRDCFDNDDEFCALVICASYCMDPSQLPNVDLNAQRIVHCLLECGYVRACLACCWAGYLPNSDDYEMLQRIISSRAEFLEQPLSVSYIQQVTSLPRSLLMSAVYVLRRQMRGNIFHKTKQLKIPNALKSFITLENVMECAR